MIIVEQIDRWFDIAEKRYNRASSSKKAVIRKYLKVIVFCEMIKNTNN
jgi:hypothetical protein